MGTGWSARIVAARPDTETGILAVLDRIVARMSHWEPGSDLCRFNRAAPGAWQQLDPELSRVLGAGLSVAAASNGAFDPAMGGLVDLWGFGPPGLRSDIPLVNEIAAVRGGNVEHDPALLRARRTAPAALDFSGIAKGYAVDAIATHLRETGHADFLVEVGGELLGEGVKPDGQPWWVDLEPAPGVAPIRVALHDLAVATSGAGQRNFVAGDRRYSHTLDPRTGGPIANGVAQVTVIHAECMFADAWATALTVLGADAPAVAEREGLAMHMAVRDGGAMREVISPALAEMLSN